MSVILDALKKAEADRQRDGVTEIRGVQSTARLANDRQRRLWFIFLLGTLVFTGAAWLTFVKNPPTPSENAISAQKASGSAKETASIALITGETAQSGSNLGDLQSDEDKNIGSYAPVHSNAVGASSMSSDAFLPALAPELIQMSTGAAKRADAAQNVVKTLPTLAIPSTGAAQPIFAQLQATQSAASGLVIEDTAQAQTASRQAATNTLASTTESTVDVTPNSQIAEAASAPAPELVLEAAKQTANAAAIIPELYQLDYPTRQALPKLGLTVHVFDPNPARSFVIVNNKRFGEGEQIEGGVLIAKIRREGVECEFNGQRFILPRQL